jgi:cytochrome c oxidase subunit 2
MSLSVVSPHLHLLAALVDNPITNAFSDPASSVAQAAVKLSWRAFWTFLPFIVLAEALLVYGIFRFRKRPGREAAKFHHGPVLELVWTLIPTIAVFSMFAPSVKTLRYMLYGPPAQVNVTVVGHQFFWEYKYPQYGIDISNEAMVVPEGENVNLDMTSVDVIHGFYVPSLGIQEDALPGRITNLWFNADKTGTFKGQCTQLCGALHSEMFIDVKVLPRDQFAAWVAAHQSQSAHLATPATSITHPSTGPMARVARLFGVHGAQEGNL